MQDLERGSQLGEYTLVGKHWDGALGDVWICRRDNEPRPKLYALRRLEALDEPTQARLLSWGCALGQLDDPGLAGVLDFVVDPDCPAIVERLVVGESVRQVCRVVRGLSPRFALSAVRILAHSLLRLYEARGARGERLALHAGALDATQVVVDYDHARLVILEPGLTQTLDPEAPADVASDLHALGRLMWEMLAGRAPPAKGRIPSPRSVGARCTQQLEHLLKCVLASDPSKRYSSLPVFLRELEACLDELGGPLDVPEELRRVIKQRLPHRVHAMKTLATRWKEIPLVPTTVDLPRLGPRRASSTTGDLPRQVPQIEGLPLRPPPEMMAEAAFDEALPILAPVEMDTGDLVVGARTDDLIPRTTDLPTPRASVLQAFRQLTWLGVLAIVALAAAGYASTAGGQAAIDTLFSALAALF